VGMRYRQGDALTVLEAFFRSLLEREGQPVACRGRRPRRAAGTVLPQLARWPSGEKTTAATGSACPSNRRSTVPVRTSQSRTVRSALAESSRLPSGDTARSYTAPPWPCNWRSSRPLSWSQRWTTGSSAQLVATARRAGTKATAKTSPPWPANRRSSLPVRTSHRAAVLSLPAVKDRLPPGPSFSPLKGTIPGQQRGVPHG
jgi:hypothetical protein